MPLPAPNAFIKRVYHRDDRQVFRIGLCNVPQYQLSTLGFERSLFYHDPPANFRLIVDEMVCERCEEKSKIGTLAIGDVEEEAAT
ncbi:hypothetical protein IFM46972_08473 [Aspergillus udagawae]|uniref:Uncharacterized protein n=1 Tax=Aspergillus udagawae TaxID=91492 RepID=A0A8H3S333_9EURO|nr:hypothetical protein IFM46972_08473 [Aspergillus udagawae]